MSRVQFTFLPLSPKDTSPRKCFFWKWCWGLGCSGELAGELVWSSLLSLDHATQAQTLKRVELSWGRTEGENRDLGSPYSGLYRHQLHVV